MRITNKETTVCLLFRKEKTCYFNNINTKSIVDKKCFWKTLKSLFSDKNRFQEMIALIKKIEIISNELKVVQTFNNYFVNIVPSLKINYNTSILPELIKRAICQLLSLKRIFFQVYSTEIPINAFLSLHFLMI